MSPLSTNLNAMMGHSIEKTSRSTRSATLHLSGRQDSHDDGQVGQRWGDDNCSTCERCSTVVSAAQGAMLSNLPVVVRILPAGQM